MNDKEINNGNILGSALKSLSPKDFLSFGIQEVAYIRSVRIDGRTAYAIHAADGTPLTIMDEKNLAITTVQHNELSVATVH